MAQIQQFDLGKVFDTGVKMNQAANYYDDRNMAIEDRQRGIDKENYGYQRQAEQDQLKQDQFIQKKKQAAQKDLELYIAHTNPKDPKFMENSKKFLGYFKDKYSVIDDDIERYEQMPEEELKMFVGNLRRQKGLDQQTDKFEKGTPYVNEAGKRVVPIYDKNTKELLRTEELGKPQIKLDPVDQNKIKSIGDAIIEGKQPPKIGRELGKMAGPLRAYLAENGFNQSEAMLDYNATKKHINTLNSVGQLRLAQATNFANHSLDLVVDLAEEWKGGNFAILNKANLAAARSGVYGEEAASLATRLSSQISDLQSELAVVYKGGNSPTDAGLEQASEQLKAEWGEKVLKDNVELIRKNLTIRQRSMKAIGVAGASDANPYAGKQKDPHKKTKYKEGQTANGGKVIFSGGVWRDNI